MNTDEQTIIKPGLELTPFDAVAEIKKFPIKKEDLTALAAKYAGLTINGLDDKEGYKAVVAARKHLKKERTNITNLGKEAREFTTKYNRLVIEKEKELIGEIEPTEEALQAQEEEYDRLKAEVEKEEERQKAVRIQSMLQQLNAVECGVDIFDLQAMSDEQFTELLGKATLEYEVVKVKREQERLKKEEADRHAEKDRAELALKLEQERLRQEEERVRQEREREQLMAREREIQLQRQELEAEKKKIHAQRTKAREDRLKAIGMWESNIGMLYKHEHAVKTGQVLFGRAHILDLNDEGFEELFVMIAKHVNDHREEGERNKAAKEAQAEKARKQREKEEKKEKELRMSDAERFTEIKNKIMDLMGSPIWLMQSAWGKIAKDKIVALLDEAVEVCKANEQTGHGK